MDKVSVVIVSWNVAKSLDRCLTSVFATNYPSLEVLVIDNDSADGSVQVIKSFKRVRLIKNASNVGFPWGVNQGFQQSTGDFVLLLNPDTRIPKDFFQKAIIFFKRHPKAGVMGPKFVNPDGTIQGSVFREPSVIGHIQEFWLDQKGRTAKYAPDISVPTIVNSVSGGCMFIPRSTLEKIGYFTQKVFMFYEDLDFCRRIRKAGLFVYFNPEIEIVHEHGQSTKQSGSSNKYLWDASLWYNGFVKHYLMWFIAWTGQKLRRVFA